MLNEAADATISHEDQLCIVQECIEDAKKLYGEDRFWGLKIIYSTLRFVKGSVIALRVLKADLLTPVEQFFPTCYLRFRACCTSARLYGGMSSPQTAIPRPHHWV